MPATSTVTKLHPAEIRIESGVPMPPPRANGSDLLDALRRLTVADVGASFLIEGSGQRVAQHVRVAANRIGGPGWVTTRETPDGRRVWKIAEPEGVRRIRKN